MLQITIPFLYIIAGASFALSRLPHYAARHGLFAAIGVITGLGGLVVHGLILRLQILPAEGLVLSIGNTASFIGLQLALTALVISFEPMLRGLASGLILLAAMAAAFTGWSATAPADGAVTWQMQAHVLISLFAYGLLAVGAIVAVYALAQDRRLRAGRLSPINELFAPLEMNERLLYGIAAAGFLALLLAVFSGILFVDDLFAQHLVHKTSLSLLALVLFGILLGGRWLAGWRGKTAVYLYLWGFAILGLAYFGSRFVLEEILGRSWG